MNFQMVRLGDVADVRWGDTSTTKDKYVPDGYTAYSASGPDGFLPYADYEKTGVVLSAIGSQCGKTWLARGKWSCIKNTIRFFSTTEDVITEYLYWATRDPNIWPSKGSGQPFISQGDARDLCVRIPPLSDQREIASILGALDNKIDLNRRMAATLEEMARALYRSWFVDFDPVKAKAEGLTPAYMDEATAALFPDRFGDDGLPEGWPQASLSEIATFLNGAALQKFPPADDEESLPVIKIAELRNGVTSTSNRASIHLPSKYRIDNGDVLFSWSGSLLQKVWTAGPGALNQHLFKVSSEKVPKWFHYFAVDRHMEEFRQIAQSKATTMGHIQRHHLDAALVAVPDAKVMIAADGIFGKLFDRMVALNIESRTLSELRDTLLPKLMSGELPVGEARDQIGEAA